MSKSDGLTKGLEDPDDYKDKDLSTKIGHALDDYMGILVGMLVTDAVISAGVDFK